MNASAAAATTGGGAVKAAAPAAKGGGGTSDAAIGARLVLNSEAIKSALGRIKVALDELRSAIEALVARLRGGRGGAVGGVAGGGASSPVQQVSVGAAGKGTPVQGGGPISTNPGNRASAIPALRPGQSEQLTLARNQVTYRSVTVNGGSSGTTFTPPATPAGMDVEIYAIRDYSKGAQHTQVLEPVKGPITVPAGQDVKFVARVRGTTAGSYSLDIGGAKLDVKVSQTAIDALPMMAWINESNASKRGASAASMASVLSHFGVAATGNSGVAVTSASNRSPVQYFSAAYEAATRANPAETARRIIEAERKAHAANPNSAFWVQVSDEQDKDGASAQQTTAWIKQVKSYLQQYGSDAKLFVAAQARPFNLVYASVVDGWANTQSAAGRTRDTAIADIRSAASSYGRNIELMEYPGNAFFDAQTPGSAAVSTASAALDGANSWFIYSANNQDILERGGGDEGRGDIGGLVVVENGRVLPTISLIEAELGANIGSAARTFGATGTSGAQQVAYTSDRLDAYKHTGQAVDLRLWEQEIARLIG
ncbi:MAG: hypothetical protein KDC46_06520 [Thermoleophilia bacterium]|nr:hypothetical protein [Thermoleophilia bacterium]